MSCSACNHSCGCGCDDAPNSHADVAYIRRRCNDTCDSDGCGCNTLRLCVDCDGSSDCFECCRRDPFWPNFCHPRTLSCAELYCAN